MNNPRMNTIRATLTLARDVLGDLYHHPDLLLALVLHRHLGSREEARRLYDELRVRREQRRAA